MSIKTVFFDCGNVLVTYKTQIFFDVLKSHSQCGFNPKDFFGSFDKGLFAQFELGHIDVHEFYEGINDRFDFDSTFGVNEFVKLFTDATIVPDRAMIEIKNALNRNDLDLVLVSNNNHVHMDFYRNKYPDVLSHFVFSMVSSEVGMRKPDLDMFIRPMEALGYKADECLLIEDRTENLEAFRSLGGLGYRYDPTKDNMFVNQNLLHKEREYLIQTLIRLGLLK